MKQQPTPPAIVYCPAGMHEYLLTASSLIDISSSALSYACACASACCTMQAWREGSTSPSCILHTLHRIGCNQSSLLSTGDTQHCSCHTSEVVRQREYL